MRRPTLRVQHELRWARFELVFPPCRLRYAVRPPDSGFVEQHPYIPARTVAPDQRLKGGSDQPLPIPEVRRARVGQEAHRAENVLLLCAELRRPDDVHRHVLRRVLAKPGIPERNCALKTFPSRGRREEDRANLAGVGVERSAKCIEAGQALVSARRRGGAIARRRQKEQGGEQCTSVCHGALIHEGRMMRSNTPATQHPAPNQRETFATLLRICCRRGIASIGQAGLGR